MTLMSKTISSSPLAFLTYWKSEHGTPVHVWFPYKLETHLMYRWYRLPPYLFTSSSCLHRFLYPCASCSLQFLPFPWHFLLMQLWYPEPMLAVQFGLYCNDSGFILGWSHGSGLTPNHCFYWRFVSCRCHYCVAVQSTNSLLSARRFSLKTALLVLVVQSILIATLFLTSVSPT